jgi:hypothetical protein
MDYTYRERHEEAIYRFKGDTRPNDFFHRNVVLSGPGGRARHPPARRDRRREHDVGSDYPHSESTFPQSRRISPKSSRAFPPTSRRRSSAATLPASTASSWPG